jgi:hypothetical protein
MPHRATPPLLTSVAAATVLAAACGVGRSFYGANGAPAPPPAATLHLQSSAGITTVVAGGRWSAPGAVATPDWRTVFTVEAGRLLTLDGLTGAERAAQPVAPRLRPVVSSADGQLVALTDSPIRIGQGILPPGRSHSTVVVAPADAATGATRTSDVDGNVVPEGFSTDHTRLFVIEFLPATNPDRYRVRSLDLTTGQLGPVYTYDKTIDTEVMQGLSRTQVFSPAGPYGTMLYTLYSRAGGVGGYDDVHALSLDGGLVHCTDLPASFQAGVDAGAITVSPDGRRVYVASADGAVAEIDTSGTSQQLFPVLHTAQLAPAGVTRTVAITADDQTVWVALGARLTALHSADLHPVVTTSIDQAIAALAEGRAGSLYAATAATVESIVPSTGARHLIATIDTPPARLAVSH